MSVTVRLFAHSGIIVLPIASNNQQLVGSQEFMLKQRYLAREKLTADTSTAVLSGAPLSADVSVKMLHVQVQPQKRIHYEVYGPNADAAIADTSSPVIEGEDNLEFYTGWKISLLEVTEE